MYITLYLIVTHLPDSLCSVKDHFLSLDPTSLTVDLLEQHLLAAETRVVALGAARGTRRTPFFEGCSPTPLAPSYASAAAVDILSTEDVGAASASASAAAAMARVAGVVEGAAGVVVGAALKAVASVEVVATVGVVAGVRALAAVVVAAVGVAVVAAVAVVAVGLELSMEVLEEASGNGSSVGAIPRRPSSFTCGKAHTQHRCFSRLDDAWHVECGDEVERPHSAELLRSGVEIFDLDYDAIITAMYALCASAESDCYRCVPPDPGVAAVALGFSESVLPGIGPAEALHTFTLDSGLHLPSFSTNLVSIAALQDAMVTTTTPRGQRVSICTCTRTGRHLATITRRLGSSLYTLDTEPPQVAASAQVSASGQVSPPSSCRLLSHHRLGHPSLPRLRGMHSRLLVSGLPRSLPPLPPSPAQPCLPCFVGRLRAAPHSSSFPPTTAPLQTLHMDVRDPARVSGQGRERYFLLVVDDNTRYTTILIPWIRAVRLQIGERLSADLPVVRLYSDRGGEFSSDLLPGFCRGEGILQSFTLPDSPEQNGIAERRIGLVMEVTHTSMIHAAAPHFLWPFAVRYVAHQLKLRPRVSFPETSPTLRWTGKVGNASVFRVWGSGAFVRDTSADKLSTRAIPCVFLGFTLNTPGWQFYHPTLRCVFPSQDVTFDESVPFYRLFPYRSGPLPPPALFLTPDPLSSTAHVEVAVGSGAARGAASGGAASGGADPMVAESEGAQSRGAEPGGEGTGGAEPAGVELGGREPEGVEPGGAESEGADFGGAEPRGAASSGATGAKVSRAGGAGVTARAGGAAGTAATGPGGARTKGTGAAGTGGVGGSGAGDPTKPGAAGAGGFGAGSAAAGGARSGGTGTGGAGAGGAGVGGTGAGGTGARGAGSVLSSTCFTPPLLCPPPYQMQLPLPSASPLPAPSPYTE
ncbi:unnamed protein product [Closterium sp. NIES-54]